MILREDLVKGDTAWTKGEEITGQKSTKVGPTNFGPPSSTAQAAENLGLKSDQNPTNHSHVRSR